MKCGHVELDAKASAALERFFDRTGWSPVDNEKPGDRIADKPFDEWLTEKGLDGCEEEVGEYELRQRKAGVKIFYRYLASKGVHPASLLRWLVSVGRGLHAEPWHLLTMHEAGDLMDETAAAHSHRCKLISGEIRLHNMSGKVLGDRLPGQKSKAASEAYKACRKGNCNRKGGKKELKRRARDARRNGKQAMPD